MFAFENTIGVNLEKKHLRAASIGRWRRSLGTSVLGGQYLTRTIMFEAAAYQDFDSSLWPPVGGLFHGKLFSKTFQISHVQAVSGRG